MHHPEASASRPADRAGIDHLSRHYRRRDQAHTGRNRLAVEDDFFLGFSPEREDPGNRRFEVATLPKVVEAAKSKPFGYMPFYPGPGLGGHCVPIDPFYLTWKAREYELPTRCIELAAEINTAMPRHVVDELAKALDRRCGKALSRSRILIIGLAYKKNVPDIRESPSLRLIELIEEWGGKAEFHDPHVTEIPATREHMAIKGRRSVELTEAALKDFDAVVVATDHDAIDYQAIADHALLIVDTRNVFGRLGLAPRDDGEGLTASEPANFLPDVRIVIALRRQPRHINPLRRLLPAKGIIDLEGLIFGSLADRGVADQRRMARLRRVSRQHEHSASRNFYHSHG
ncbi:hypothetical protein MES4922_140018 [Mesorhizobium ventifaucium]|uniref:UDP-glucose/GDP-mannose dehydrogenase C-terminal domain-containing protein n=1 Tax=Mesorhizobium ventifaucium TaxID=666020 RepID=A0ABN8JEF3_9HYPH|nr:hypothetical protein MES4922_140018 [Mesorhizobium ventifaucium]